MHNSIPNSVPSISAIVHILAEPKTNELKYI